jgi:hypothetical protein
MEGQPPFFYLNTMRKIILLAIVTLLVHLSRKVHLLAATRRLQDGCHDGCENYQYKGKQELVYSNNSSDTLKKNISFV